MTIRYITLDWCGRVYEIANLIDQFGNDTRDPLLAAACVIKLDESQGWQPTTTDELQVYTVH